MLLLMSSGVHQHGHEPEDKFIVNMNTEKN